MPFGEQCFGDVTNCLYIEAVQHQANAAQDEDPNLETADFAAVDQVRDVNLYCILQCCLIPFGQDASPPPSPASFQMRHGAEDTSVRSPVQQGCDQES